MTEEESNQILAEVDADHSGQVDFDEFKLYWVKAKQAGPGEPDFSRPKLSRLEAAEDQSVAGPQRATRYSAGWIWHRMNFASRSTSSRPRRARCSRSTPRQVRASEENARCRADLLSAGYRRFGRDGPDGHCQPGWQAPTLSFD